MLACIGSVYAADPVNAPATFNMKSFQEIPVLQDGRVKPLDSFARAYLLIFSGKDSLPEMTASAWLAELLFTPEKDYQRRLFKIPNRAVAESIGISWRPDHYYSFAELSKALDASEANIKAIDALDEKQRGLEQRQLLDLYTKVLTYGIISDTFSLVTPQFRIKNQSLAKELHLPVQQDLSYLDILPHEAEILRHIDTVKNKKISELTDEDKGWIYLALAFSNLSRHEQSMLFRIIPPQWQSDHDVWTAPWTSVLEGHGSPQSSAYLNLWRQLGTAYASHDLIAWKSLSQEIHDHAYQLAGVNASLFKQRLEVLYLRVSPFTVALAFYFVSFALLLVSIIGNQHFFYRAAFVLMPIGALVHMIGLVMRIIIMSRPPVSTLYETTIFVSFVAVFLSLLFEWRRKDVNGIFVGALIGVLLLSISMHYAAQGDTMEMLVAVLNTNFWLATHVVMITMGYGCSLVAGMLGHVYLLQVRAKPKDTIKHNNLMNMMLAAGLIAAFFTMLGTILGGIWADQSWGRFWGWDPKENGAMLIALWLLWLLHGRIANVLSPSSFATGMALTNVIVALSWFGVNLLGVGLHSYGFTSNIAFSLAFFCGGEVIFIAGLRFFPTIKVSRG